MPEYTNARYVNDPFGVQVGISVLINGAQSFVPIAPGNVDYDNMMVLVAEGKLVIAPAESV